MLRWPGSRRGPRVPSPAAVPSLCPVPAALPHGCALRRAAGQGAAPAHPLQGTRLQRERDAAKQQPWLLNAAEEGRASANTFTGLHTPAGCHAPGFKETLQLLWVQSVRPRPPLRLETLNSRENHKDSLEKVDFSGGKSSKHNFPVELKRPCPISANKSRSGNLS